MKKFRAVITLLVFCMPLRAGAEDPFVWRTIDNQAFQVGEYLRYVMRWGLVHGGYSSMEVDSIVPINGREAYHLVSKTRTNSFFDSFFMVRDINQSWLDTVSISSHRFSKDVREGGYKKKEWIDYAYDSMKVRIHKNDTVIESPLMPFIQDVLSALYYVRTQPMKTGTDLSVEVNTSGKDWPMIVKVYGQEKIEVACGKFSCLRIEPLLKDEGLFETKGRILVWVTDDARHIPVKMRTKIKIGSITAELISMQRNADDDNF
jgi:hypothetical protein